MLDNAPQFVAVGRRKSGIKKVPLLQGRLVVNWFHEPSTRTRTSFELAAKRLSAGHPCRSRKRFRARSKGKPSTTPWPILKPCIPMSLLSGTVAPGAPHILAATHDSHIVNAGDGRHEHPTQALLDAFTIRERIREQRKDEAASLDGVKVTIIGDIEHSRVARSDIWALNKLGAEVTLCGPATLMPMEVERMGVRVTSNLREALEDTDVVYVLRIQLERQSSGLFPSLREYIRLFRVDNDSLRHAPDHALVMHPGPINRDLELATEVADGSRSVILEQVSNGVAIRMAVMDLLVNRGGQ